VNIPVGARAHPTLPFLISITVLSNQSSKTLARAIIKKAVQRDVEHYDTETDDRPNDENWKSRAIYASTRLEFA
jgi:hypothetical protein